MLIVVGHQSLWARGCEITDPEDFWGLDPDAVGDEVIKGDVAVYYEEVTGNPGNCFIGPTTNMIFGLRMSKRGEPSSLFLFSGTEIYSDYPPGDWPKFCYAEDEGLKFQVEKIKEFISETVIPHFLDEDDDYCGWALKKVTKWVDTEDGHEPRFTMLYVVIVVDTSSCSSNGQE
jgi:hypothetical protein